MDLEANPTVDAEHPPDLKAFTDTAEPAASVGHGDSNAASAQVTASAAQNGVATITAKQSPAAKLAQPQAHSAPQATDVAVITEIILRKVNNTWSVAVSCRRHVVARKVLHGGLMRMRLSAA